MRGAGTPAFSSSTLPSRERDRGWGASSLGGLPSASPFVIRINGRLAGEIGARLIVGAQVAKWKFDPPLSAASNDVPPAIVDEAEAFEFFSQPRIGRLGARSPLLVERAGPPG